MLIILYKKIFDKGYSENFSREIFIVDSVLKANPWICKVKDVSGERIFYEYVINKSLSTNRQSC